MTRTAILRCGRCLSIIEVELIEPIFSFNLVPDSIIQLVNAKRNKFETQANTTNQKKDSYL